MTGATLFFQLVNRRYEVGSIILTSNRSSEEWGHSGDEVMPEVSASGCGFHAFLADFSGSGATPPNSWASSRAKRVT